MASCTSLLRQLPRAFRSSFRTARPLPFPLPFSLQSPSPALLRAAHLIPPPPEPFPEPTNAPPEPFPEPTNAPPEPFPELTNAPSEKNPDSDSDSDATPDANSDNEVTYCSNFPIRYTRKNPAYFLIAFTCNPCGHRSRHQISKHGYYKGSILIACPDCHNRHVISDNLKIFGDRAITVEDLMRENGSLVKRGTLGEDGDIEFWPDETPSSQVHEVETDSSKTV